MTTSLWSDERIARTVGAADFRHYEEDLVEELMRQMRDEYEARVAELQSLLDAYAQRITDQDTEIAMLRQREEMR